MWRLYFPFGQRTDTLALEANADRARQALACAYSSSAEFEADVIRARRQAGAYGPRRHQTVVVVAIATALIAVAAFVVQL